MRLPLFVLALSASCAIAQVANPPSGNTGSPGTGPSVAQKIAIGRQLLDLNTAAPAQLRALPGMGDAYVKRIVDGRPYTAKFQLLARGILPREAYEGIKDRIIAHRSKPRETAVR
jgi:hypothetical protein